MHTGQINLFEILGTKWVYLSLFTIVFVNPLKPMVQLIIVNPSCKVLISISLSLYGLAVEIDGFGHNHLLFAQFIIIIRKVSLNLICCHFGLVKNCRLSSEELIQAYSLHSNIYFLN